MTQDKICPIWGTPAEEIGSSDYGRKIDVRSSRAGGKYSIMQSAKTPLGTIGSSVKARLSLWIVNQHRMGEEWPIITNETIKDIQNCSPLSVQERLDNFLRYLKTKSTLLGTVIEFDSEGSQKNIATTNELLAWTESTTASEIVTLAEYCREANYIEHRSTASVLGFSINEVMLKTAGYTHLAKLESYNSNSKQAFVAMWFDDSMQEAYLNGISPGIRAAGYKPVRIDGKEHNNRIDDEIISEIRRSRFLVADFSHGETGARGGVYYEAGFAHGFNIPVIFTCHQNSLKNVHFDTRQYNHIVWETAEELCERLSQRISATIGDGPLKNKKQ